MASKSFEFLVRHASVIIEFGRLIVEIGRSLRGRRTREHPPHDHHTHNQQRKEEPHGYRPWS